MIDIHCFLRVLQGNMMTQTPIKMLCIGEPLLESVAELQADSSIDKLRATGGFAGDVAPNFASYANMAGKAYGVPVEVDVLTAVGGKTHDESNAAVADLEARGINMHAQSLRIEGKTIGKVTNLKNPDGTTPSEKVRMDRKHSAFRDLLNDATDDDLKKMSQGYTHLVVSGIPLACVHQRGKLVRLIRFAKEQNPDCKIIVSTNLRPSNWRMPDNEYAQGIQENDPAWKSKAKYWLDEIIPLADVLFANASDEKQVRGSKDSIDARRKLRTLNKKADIIVTDDAKDIQLSYLSSRKQEQLATIPTAPLSAPEPIDTVGGGDSLAATYVMAREAGCTREKAVQVGSNVASQVVMFDGALPKVGEEPDFPLLSLRPNDIRKFSMDFGRF